MELTGGCVCGGTRLRQDYGAADTNRHEFLRTRGRLDCHRIDCRRSAGAPYVQWGSVPREDLIVTKGEPRKIAYANRIPVRFALVGQLLSLQ